MEGEVIEVSQFIPSVHKLSKHFGFNFARSTSLLSF